MSVIPFNLPNVPMLRIIWHWTAGTHKANATDKKAYHVLIEGVGTVIKGIPGIERNSGTLKDGYAAHTLSCNTDSIGVSLCAMAGAVESPFNAGSYPITPEQIATLTAVLAELCTFYNIPVTPQTVLSHAEVQANLGIKQRNKWDIARLPFGDRQTAKTIGDYVRQGVMHEMAGGITPPISSEVDPMPTPVNEPVPEGAQAVVATNGGSLTLRASADGSSIARGPLPNGTPLEVLTILPNWVEVQTPFGVIGWVSRPWIKMVDGPKPVEPTKPSDARLLVSEIRAKLDDLEKLL